jgi:hypothetical protein
MRLLLVVVRSLDSQFQKFINAQYRHSLIKIFRPEKIAAGFDEYTKDADVKRLAIYLRLAGAKRLELLTLGFGDRCSTN